MRSELRGIGLCVEPNLIRSLYCYYPGVDLRHVGYLTRAIVVHCLLLFDCMSLLPSHRAPAIMSPGKRFVTVHAWRYVELSTDM